jgi:hypothetical protein
MIMWRVFGAGALALLRCASMQLQQAAVAQGMKACISSRVTVPSWSASVARCSLNIVSEAVGVMKLLRRVSPKNHRAV